MIPSVDSLPLTLYPGRVRTALMLLLCLGFVAIGWLMVRDGEWSGYFVGGCFALGVPVFALQLHRRAAYLRLDEAGFTFCSLFRAQTVRWKDVAEFGLIKIGMNRLVAWNFVPGHPRTGRARAISQAMSGYEAALPDSYGLKPAELADRMDMLRRRWGEPPARPFFSASEIARLVRAQPVRGPLPFDPDDDDAIRRFYAEAVRRIERELGLAARVEWHHYGSGYASFIDAWFYPVDGRARLSPFEAGGERHVGLTVLLSRLSPFFVLAQDEKSWSADGGSGGLPNFAAVDDIVHPALLPLVAPVAARLASAGLRRLSRRDLAAPLSGDVPVPTILTDGPLRQFDALFYWED